MEKKIGIQRYKQNGQSFVSFIIDYRTLRDISQVLVYGENQYGYQRKPDRKHSAKIKRYLLEDREAILPASIVLGADMEIMKACTVAENGHDYLVLKDGTESIFRVVDGQHRLRALEEAVKEDPGLMDFMFNAVVIVTEQKERHRELGIFTDINSKSKRIRVDLAMLAKYNYEIYDGEVEDLAENIAIKTAYRLKENKSEKNVWRNGIKFDVHEDKALGIVSVNAFVSSIKPLCNKYLRDVDFQLDAADNDAIYEITEKASLFIEGLLVEAWTIVAEKWGGCFTPMVENDYFYDIKEYFYDRKYYIQKTLGVNVINSILYDAIRKTKITEYNLGHFYRTIIASNVNIVNWSSGDIFAGLSSDAGFRIAKKHVLNKKVD